MPGILVRQRLRKVVPERVFPDLAACIFEDEVGAAVVIQAKRTTGERFEFGFVVGKPGNSCARSRQPG